VPKHFILYCGLQTDQPLLSSCHLNSTVVDKVPRLITWSALIVKHVPPGSSGPVEVQPEKGPLMPMITGCGGIVGVGVKVRVGVEVGVGVKVGVGVGFRVEVGIIGARVKVGVSEIIIGVAVIENVGCGEGVASSICLSGDPLVLKRVNKLSKVLLALFEEPSA